MDTKFFSEVNINGKYNIKDISHIKSNMKTYGGLACKKVGVTIDGVDYMVKYPDKLKDRNLKNVKLSYSNSSTSEYLGSRIFKLFGMNTHEVGLVYRNGKLCVLCRDFVEQGRLVEFRELVSTFEDFSDCENDTDVNDLGSSNCQTDLDVVLYIIRNHRFLSNLDYEKFFWKMFVIDALIGNHDRNTGNFGFLLVDNKYEIAPIYDNGNSFCHAWDDDRIMAVLESETRMKDLAYRAYTCRYERNGKEINPFKLFKSEDNDLLDKAIEEVLCIDVEELIKEINLCPEISSIKKKFYSQLIKLRFEKIKEDTE